MPFAGRVYGDLSAAVDPASGDIYVEGTNGRDLVEFHLPARPGSLWQVTDLTNALPANRVFGTPAIYILPNGDRHILMINEDAELIEYYNVVPGQLSTQNITLSLGNSGSPPSFPKTFAEAGTRLQHAAPTSVVTRVARHHGKHHPAGAKLAAGKPRHRRPAPGLTSSKIAKKQKARPSMGHMYITKIFHVPRKIRLLVTGKRIPI
jgi:hypothetical protein